MEFSSRRAREEQQYRTAGTAVGEAGCDDHGGYDGVTDGDGDGD